ncbi:unnamed protein product, partial [Rotaria sp. Silwood2]
MCTFVKKAIRDKRSFDLRIQRIQEFQAYLENSDIEQIEATTLTLLDNFIEDADNYAQQFELHGDDDDDIGAFTDKITAVY